MRLAKSVAVSAAMAMVLVVLSASGLQAQSPTLTVTIPFAFQVADKELPAGDYTIQNVGEAIRISDRQGYRATVMSNPVWNVAKGERSELVFTRYSDGQFFLSEARWAGYKNSRGLSKSKAETRLASLSPERVSIAALIR